MSGHSSSSSRVGPPFVYRDESFVFQKRRITTVPQLEMLVEFMEAHKDIARGKMRSKESNASRKRLYDQLTPKLNQEGPKRTWKAWAKLWNDYKCKVKAKLINGGGYTQLTPLEQRVADIICERDDSIEDVNFEDIIQTSTNKQLKYWMNNVVETGPSELDVNDPLPTEDMLDSDYVDSRDNVTVEDTGDADSYDDILSSPEMDANYSDSANAKTRSPAKTKSTPEKDHNYCEDTLKKGRYLDCTEDLQEKKQKYRDGDKDTIDKDRKCFDSVEDTTDKKRKRRDCVEDTTDKKRECHDCVEDTTDKKRKCRDCVEDTTDKKRNCSDCVEGDRRDDCFGRLIAEELKLIPSCMKNTVFRHCLKLVDAFKKKHMNEDVVEVIFPH